MTEAQSGGPLAKETKKTGGPALKRRDALADDEGEGQLLTV